MAENILLKYRFEDPKLNMVLEEIMRKINDKIKWILNPHFTTCKLSDSDATHYLSLKWDEDEVVDDRDLNFKVNAGERTFDLTGNVTVESSTILDQDYTSDATVRFAKLGLGMAATNVLDVTGDSGLNGAVTINDANADKDFRVEGSGATYTHLLFTDASTNRLGINESAPVCPVHIRAAESAVYAGIQTDTIVLIENDDTVRVQLQAGSSGDATIEFCDADYNPPAGAVRYDFSDEWIEFVIGTNELMWFDSSGNIKTDGVYMHIDGDAAAYFNADSHDADAYTIYKEDGTAKWAVGFDYDDSLAFTISEGIPGTNNRLRITPTTGHLELPVAAQQIKFLGSIGANGEGVLYKDDTGVARYGLLFEATNNVVLCNRASNGTVYLRANTSSSGVGGEVTAVTVEDTDVTLADGIGFNLQEDITFSGATTENLIKIPDHLAVALDITEASNSYLKFVTTNGSEGVQFGKTIGVSVAPDLDVGIYVSKTFTDTDNSGKAGIRSETQVAKTSAAMTSAGWGVYGQIILDSTNTQNWTHAQAGLRAMCGYVGTETGSTGVISNATGLFTLANIADAATITNLVGVRVCTPTVAGSKVTNEYGIYVCDQNTGATLNYAIYTGAGLVSFGDDLLFHNTDPNIIGGDTDGALSITADTATNQGGNIKLYGNTHGSLAQDIEFYADATKVLEWDESEGNWDFNSTNIKGVGTLGSGILTITANSDTMVFTPDGTDANIQWSDGDLNLITDEATNTDTYVKIKGKGTGRGLLQIFDQDSAEYISLTCFSGNAYISCLGTSPQSFNFSYDVDVPIYFHPALESGNPVTQLHGWDSGSSTKKYLRFQVASDGDALILAEDNLDISAGGGDIFFGNENIGINQSSFGTNSVGVVAQGTGTAPTTSPADCFQMYSADQSAGNACAHFRTEGGAVIKIYQGSHIADAETSHTLTDASETCDRSEIEGFLDALGAKINAVYTAMENAGFLASS